MNLRGFDQLLEINRLGIIESAKKAIPISMQISAFHGL